jgi:hypothetical protein
MMQTQNEWWSLHIDRRVLVSEMLLDETSESKKQRLSDCPIYVAVILIFFLPFWLEYIGTTPLFSWGIIIVLSLMILFIALDVSRIMKNR